MRQLSTNKLICLPATKALGLRAKHLWSSDTSAVTREFLQEVFKPDQVYADITQRPLPELPEGSLHLYAAGFPCTPWSLLHHQSEEWQEKAAKAADSVFEVVECKTPLVFVLENVCGLRKRTAAWKIFLDKASKHFRGYDVFVLDVCPTQLGHCVRRPRLYMVGVRQDAALLQDRIEKEYLVSQLLDAATCHLLRPENCQIRWQDVFGHRGNIVACKPAAAGAGQASCKKACWREEHRSIRRQQGLSKPKGFPVLPCLTEREHLGL